MKNNMGVFLDRDGTLIQDHNHVYKTSELNVLMGVCEGLRKLQEAFHLFIVTNQSGIGRGIFTEEEMTVFHEHLLEVLCQEKIRIQKIYYCPHRPEEGCGCRKPKPQFLAEARETFSIDLPSSWVIGDKACDIQLAQAGGCSSIFVMTGTERTRQRELEEVREQPPTYFAADFLQAANFILTDSSAKFVSGEQLPKLIEAKRAAGKTIVTLNGTFDILHPGHEKLLLEAKAQGDILIVGLNTDKSVRKNKGPRRPLNKARNRARAIASFPVVDYVMLFDEPTPIEFIESIRPNVHVNGSDYGANCIEAPTVERLGGRIHIVQIVPGWSSSKIINNR